MEIKKKRLAINLILGSLALFISACGSGSELVYRTKTLDNKIRFYVSENPNFRKGEGKFFARVESCNNKIYYSFRLDYIYKTYADKDNYVYTLVSDDKDVLSLTSIDSIVLTKADKILDSLGYDNLKRSAGLKGFVKEVAGH